MPDEQHYLGSRMASVLPKMIAQIKLLSLSSIVRNLEMYSSMARQLLSCRLNGGSYEIL